MSEIVENTSGQTVRWAVVGTGAIASAFAQDLRLCTHAALVGVCSRTEKSAKDFSQRFGNLRIFPTVDALAQDRDIDAVYIATPNTAHFDAACRLIEAGKPVLVEKPLATSSTEAAALADLASRNGVFVMEGLWTVFLPAVDHVRQMLEQGEIGDVTAVTATLAYEKPFEPDSRFFSPALGGGALLDLGVYPIALTLALFGTPDTTDGRWKRAPSAVDMSATVELRYQSFTASLSCGFDRDGANRFVIDGTKGSITIDAPFLKASRVFVTRNTFSRNIVAPVGNGILPRLLAKAGRKLPLPGMKVHDHAFPGNGLQFEIDAASAAILSGRIEEARMPLARSVAAVEIIRNVLVSPAS